jgi:hypothetical protein
MNYWSITRRAAGLCVLIAAVAGGSARAATTTAVSACSAPTYSFSQPFAAIGDSNQYTLAPGQGAGSFNGTGWTLTDGAKIITTTLADGTKGSVLDLPAGSTAVSPSMCVDSDYPTARVSSMRQTTSGSGAQVFVAYTNSKIDGQSSGVVNGGSTWGASRVFQLHAGSLAGWQQAQYTFHGGTGEVQLYGFFVDPRCAR